MDWHIRPCGHAKEIIALLHDEVVKITPLADVKEQLVMLGFYPVANRPDQFDTQLRFELEKWRKFIRAANLRSQ